MLLSTKWPSVHSPFGGQTKTGFSALNNFKITVISQLNTSHCTPAAEIGNGGNRIQVENMAVKALVGDIIRYFSTD